jgi:integrase
MGRPRNPVPTYSHHKPSGQARIRVAGKDVYLGPYGSAESKREYDRIRAELEVQAPIAAGGQVRPAKTVTVAELVAAFWVHAKQHYRHEDGKPTTEIRWLKDALTDVVELYGHTPAAEFGPLAVKAVRQRWVAADYCRNTVNGRVNRLRRVFKWAASEELVPVAVYTALTTVTGLARGRTKVRESEPVGPVLDLHVAATLPALNPTVRAMALVQRLTGCRPQDVVRMRAGEIDRGTSPWVYTPPRHKTRYRGQVRTVMIGKAAQEILGPVLDGLQPGDPVFSQRREKAGRFARMRAARKTRVQPSQANRAKGPGAVQRSTPEQYSGRVYAGIVRKACDAAGVPRWHPNQLRHTFGTEVRARFGLEAAQVLLGHTKANVTQVYAARDMSLAAKVAEQIG